MDNNCLVQNVDEEMERLFSMIDTNNDGFITEKELKTMMKNLGEKVRKKDIRKMIKEADQNKDGKISYNGKLCCNYHTQGLAHHITSMQFILYYIEAPL